jgi:hypothetical protein
MMVHLSGFNNLDKPGVWLFPKLLVCLDCGFSRFSVLEKELALLAGGVPKSERSTAKEEVEGDAALLGVVL